MTPYPLQLNWQHTLKTLCQQPINAQERQKYITFLRGKLFPNHRPTDNPAVITTLPTTTLLLLIKACKHLKDWPLMIHCGEAYQKRLEKAVANQKPSRHGIDNLRLLSRAYQQTGMFDLAEHCLQQVINHHTQPDVRQPLIYEYQQLQKQRKSLPKGIKDLRGETLFLTPLQSHHEDDFLWQYADPTIGKWCNLPDFNEDDEDWQQWLNHNQKKSSKYLFAVNHLHWGFIGSVGLEIAKGIGFFHYWIGKDFQGRGYGPQAVTIMLNWARRHLGLRCCYATVYQDNIPSKKAMAKIGFQPLPFKVILPEAKDYEEELHYWGNYKSDRALFAEINHFFTQQGFEERVVPLATSQREVRLVA